MFLFLGKIPIHTNQLIRQFNLTTGKRPCQKNSGTTPNGRSSPSHYQQKSHPDIEVAFIFTRYLNNGVSVVEGKRPLNHPN